MARTSDSGTDATAKTAAAKRAAPKAGTATAPGARRTASKAQPAAVNDLASRLRQAAQRVENGAAPFHGVTATRPPASTNVGPKAWPPQSAPSAPSAPSRSSTPPAPPILHTPTPPQTPSWSAPVATAHNTAYPPPPPSYTPPASYGPPAASPYQAPRSANRTGVLVGALVAGAVALVVAVVAVIAVSGSGDSRTSTVTVPAAEGPAAKVFAPIAGYTYRAAPQSHIDLFRTAVESEAGAESVAAIAGRTVRKDGTNVAEALVIVFDPGAVLDEQRGLSEVASRLASHESVTISGANGLYGTASDGSHGFIVYKNGVALIVFGPDRGTLQQITEKLLVNVA